MRTDRSPEARPSLFLSARTPTARRAILGRPRGRPRAPSRARAGPHLAALLVVKADHHDVQDGPAGGAVALTASLLHGRPPQASTTTPTPRPARTTQSGGLQMSARAPHVRRAPGSEAADQLPHLRAAPRGHHRSATTASAASGLSPDATAASVRAGSEAAWAEPGWGRDAHASIRAGSEAAWAGPEGKEVGRGRSCMTGGAGPPWRRRRWAGWMLTLRGSFAVVSGEV